MVSYSQVQQIFDKNCAGNGCHESSAAPPLLAANLNLGASQAGPCLINVPSQADPTRLRVAPGDATASFLLCKVDPSCASLVGSPMPLGRAPLSSEEQTILRTWIQQGAQGGASGVCGAAGDTTPPTFAGATQATGGSNSVFVQWAPATDDVTQQGNLVYLLYQATTAGGESFNSPTYTSAVGATSYSIGKLALSTKYYFVVRAQDQAGNLDTNQHEVSATTLATADTTPPGFAGLSGVSVSGTSATLSWAAGSDAVTASAQISYLIYQAGAAGGENYTTASYTTGPGVTSFTVNGLTPGATYYFVVRAQDGAGNVDSNKIEKSAALAAASFAGQVQPIFAANCASGACHAGAHPQQGLDLSSTSTSYSNLVNVASSECAATKRVLPSQPSMSYLVWKLQGSGPCFSGSQMPKGGTLSQANMNIITGWIAAGAPNN